MRADVKDALYVQGGSWAAVQMHGGGQGGLVWRADGEG